MEGGRNQVESTHPILMPPQGSLWSRLEKQWSHIQVGHQGSYSVERLELLHEYCETTSLSRVVFVCLLTPVPALLVVVLLECLPLRSPSEGWAANWVFWIRVWLMLLVVIAAGSCQLNLFVPGHGYSYLKLSISVLVISATQLGTYITEAVIVGFPVPFMWQFGAFTMGIYLPVLTRLIVGPVEPLLLQNHINFRDCFAMKPTLIGVYPFCRVLYDLLPPEYRAVVVIILPIWKFGAKRFAVRMTRQVEDFIPELVAFSVDFFGSLFISVCMSTSESFHMTALFIGVDCVHSLLKFRELDSSESLILGILERRRSQLTKPNQDSSKLLEIIRGGLRNSRWCRVSSLDRVRLWASPPRLLPEKTYVQLKSLETSGLFGSRNQPASTRSSFRGEPRHRSTTRTCRHTSVAPINIISSSVNIKETLLDGDMGSQENSQSGQLVLHGLQLLFHCEYLVLVEYVECIVPFVYLVYKSVLQQLPVIRFYPGSEGKWGTAAVINLLVFAVLEVGSFLLVHLYLKRKFALSSLYQLAFVLEKQFYAVQATLLSLTIFLLQYELAHLGRYSRFERELMQLALY